MIRFIDLGKQIGLLDEDDVENDWPRQFAFFNTVPDRFVEFSGYQVFDSWEDFTEAFKGDEDPGFELERFKGLCQEWVFTAQEE